MPKGSLNNNVAMGGRSGRQGVVPLGVEGVGVEREAGHGGVGDRDAGGVVVEVEARADGEAGGGRGRADEADDRLVVDQGLAAPVDADEREEAVLDLG